MESEEVDDARKLLAPLCPFRQYMIQRLRFGEPFCHLRQSFRPRLWMLCASPADGQIPARSRIASLQTLFFVFHTAWMIFNMVGWAWRRTRPLHLLTMGLTAFSWFVLGIWHGWGFCLCTEWHWEVRRRLGYQDPERSYTALLVRSVTGVHVNQALSETVTGIVFVVAALLGGVLSLRDRRRRAYEHPKTFP